MIGPGQKGQPENHLPDRKRVEVYIRNARFDFVALLHQQLSVSFDFKTADINSWVHVASYFHVWFLCFSIMVS